MKNLQAGDVLTRISDGSKWYFLHYKPSGRLDKITTRADFTGDRGLDDKNFVHVKAWDTEKQAWAEESHEEFPITDFSID